MGRRLWGTRFGWATAVRVAPPGGKSLSEADALLRDRLRASLDLPAMGLRFRPVREEAVAASDGPTDFAVLFLSFSAFLIAAAGLLVGLFFGLGLERRAAEWGVLRAVGFGSGAVRA